MQVVYNMNDLANVDTTTETLQSGTTLIFDATTNKFEVPQQYRWWDLLTILGENNGNSNSDKKKHRCFCPYCI